MSWDPSRRVFLKGAGLAAVGIGFSPSPLLARTARAAGAGERVLVQVFLRGGVDGLNFCVPHGDAGYYRLRPTLGLRTQAGVRDLDGFFGLHPALAPLADLYREGVLALHPTIGNGLLGRSHFDAQDFMDLGTPGQRTTSDGWIERLARQIPGERLTEVVSYATRTPRAILGSQPDLVTTDAATFAIRAGSGRTAWAAEAEQLVRETYAGDGAARLSGRAVFEAIQTLRTTPALQAAPANGAVYPAGQAGAGLRMAARFIKAGLGTRCIYVNVGGAFDTHANQLNAHASEFAPLAAALVAFRQDLGSAIDDVLLMVTTEFGRTAAENGSQGTDHGFAHCGVFLGGSVRGGRVHGAWPWLGPADLNEGRDLRYTTDFRDVFVAAARWLGARDTDAVIPGYRPASDPGLFT